jgi:electron transfer flavoprotein beta subunit
MDIIVCLKQNVDMKQIRIKKDTREAVLEGLPLLFGDMDRNALEEAVRLKEKAGSGKVIALALGTAKLKDTIKDALAGGADEAVILIDPLFNNLLASGKAMVLAKAIQKIGKFDVLMVGEGSTDNYSGQVGPRLAELLDLPAMTYVRQMEFANGKMKATRNMEESFEVVESGLPVLVAVTSGINEPRIPSLMQILKAARKPLQEWNAAALGLSAADFAQNETTVLSNLAPIEQRKKIIYEGKVDENVTNLVNSLIKEGVLRG